VGDFYFEIAVQIIEVCIKTKNQNGGIIELNELRERVSAMRNRYSRAKFNTKAQEISNDDIKRSITNVQQLGNGYKLLLIGGRYYVQSVPCELTHDHTELLATVAHLGDCVGVTVKTLADELGWNTNRVEQALSLLEKEGFAWIDTQSPDNQMYYWFPGLIDQSKMEQTAQ
jgi:ESCRT-II complex subunit VPS22